MRRWMSSVVVAVSLVAGPARGADETPGEAPSKLTEAQRVERLLERLDQRMESLHVPGVGVAVVTLDRVILSASRGFRNIERSEPVTADTLFAIGSSTKAFTATLVGIAADEGLMTWDDPVTKHVSEFRLADEEAAKQANFRDLLSHRTGLMRTDLLWYGGRLSRQELIEAVGNAGLRKPFRSAWQYNNIMYVVAGEAAARAMKATWEALVHDRLFAPLGMTRSTTGYDVFASGSDVATGYDWDETKKTYHVKKPRNLTAVAPAGAIVSSASDMARWIQLNLGRGEIHGKRIVAAGTLEETWKPLIKMDETGLQYGMGWMIHEVDGRRVVEHGGNIDGFTAQVGFFPDDGIGYVLLTNVSATALQSEVAGIVSEYMLSEWDPSALPPDLSQYDPYLGKYHFEQLKTDVTVLTQNGRLAVDVPGQMVFELKPPDAEGKWAFAITDGISVAFERDHAGKVTGMKLFQAGLTLDLPREGYVAPVEVTVEEAAKYLGRYWDEDLKTEITVLHRHGRLAVDVPGQMIFDLRRSDEEGRWAFRATDTISITFQTDGDVAKSLTVRQDGRDTVCPRVAAAESPVDAVDALVDAHREVFGAAHVAELLPLVVEAEIDLPHQGLKGRITTTAPDLTRFRASLDMGRIGRIDSVVTPDAMATLVEGEEEQIEHGLAACQSLLQHPLALATDWKAMQSVEPLHRERVGEHECQVVRLKSACGAETLVWVDTKSHLIHRQQLTVTTAGMGIETDYRFFDWRPVGGVLLPHRIESENAFEGRMTTVVTKVERAADVDEAEFNVKSDE
jgi:CubicO group peptidase (beta-lactamase class C family)